MNNPYKTPKADIEAQDKKVGLLITIIIVVVLLAIVAVFFLVLL